MSAQTDPQCATGPRRLARHGLAWLTPRGWERACAAAPAGARAAMADWASHGWPAVVTRSPAALAPGHVALGLALPPRPDGCKPRIALIAAAADIERAGPALALAAVIGAAPAPWRVALAALDREAAAAGLVLRVYGSLAFQALTGQAYTGARSDVDLLLHPPTRAHHAQALALLARHAEALPLDGEIVFGDARAVAWKELMNLAASACGSEARVLAKSLDAVSLVKVGHLLATLPGDAPCMR